MPRWPGPGSSPRAPERFVCRAPADGRSLLVRAHPDRRHGDVSTPTAPAVAGAASRSDRRRRLRVRHLDRHRPADAADLVGGRASTDFFDALFTSTSAVCVTGLTVVDTATHWSGFGLVVILLLIQVGGFGIMILAAMLGLARRPQAERAHPADDRRRSRARSGRAVRARSSAASSGCRCSSRALVFVPLFLRFWLGYENSVARGRLAGAVPRGVLVQQRRIRAVQRQPHRLRRRPVDLPAAVRRDHPRRTGVPGALPAASRVPAPPALEHEHADRADGDDRAARGRDDLHHRDRVGQPGDARRARPAGRDC